MEQPYKTIAAAIDAYYPRYREISMEIFNNPELGMEEFHAVKILTAELTQLGFKVEVPYRGMSTAFRAEAPGDHTGPKVALLPEYDALPEIGHACGHNLIAVSCLAAAVGALTVADSLNGSFVLIGAPDEEGDGGKIQLLEKGGYTDIDYALSVHPGMENKTRRLYRATHSFLVIFKGRSSHAASEPEKGINALDALGDFYQAFRKLRDSQPRAITLNAIVREGGIRTNIIPDHCVVEINVRTPDVDLQAGLEKQIHDLAETAAANIGAKVEYKLLPYDYKNMKTDPVLVELYEANLVRLGETYLTTSKDRVGSTDVGNLSHEFPVIHPWMAVVPEGNPENVSGHHQSFAAVSSSEFGHSQMLKAAKAMAFTIYDLLK